MPVRGLLQIANLSRWEKARLFSSNFGLKNPSIPLSLRFCFTYLICRKLNVERNILAQQIKVLTRHMSLSDTSFAELREKTFQNSSFLAAMSQAYSFQSRFYLQASLHRPSEPRRGNGAIKKIMSLSKRWSILLMPCIRYQDFTSVSRPFVS